MASRKTVAAKEFYSDNLEEYIGNLQKVRPEAGNPLILKPNTKAEDAVASVKKVVNGGEKDNAKFNKNLMKLVAKKGGEPTVKKVYQSVLLTFFKTNEVEYDYRYEYNGNTVNISPKRISINEGYAEFTAYTQCFVGDLGSTDRISYHWEMVTEDRLVKTPEAGYVFANVFQSDCDKDSKASMKQYNSQLKDWLMDFQQNQLGKAREMEGVTIYDKDYDYSEAVLLAPFILVSYDLGDSIVTFSVNALTGGVEGAMLNNPAARFEHDASAVAPSFNVVLFILASVAMIVLGGVLYLLWYFSNKLTYKKKSLRGYTVEELRKLL